MHADTKRQGKYFTHQFAAEARLEQIVQRIAVLHRRPQLDEEGRVELAHDVLLVHHVLLRGPR